MLGMCYFYLKSHSPSEGCVFVAERKWGCGVVGEGQVEGTWCDETALRKDELRVFSVSCVYFPRERPLESLGQSI